MPTVTGRLAGRRIVVTGAASGIGAALARLAADEGAQVACLDRDQTGARVVAASLSLPGYGIGTDVTKQQSVHEAIEMAAAEMAGIDGLVNSAGVVALGPVAEMTQETWQQMIDVNLTGSFLMCKAAIPHLLQAGEGAAIVNISSAQALLPVAGAGAYAASKGGVQSLSKALAVELAPTVRVNAVCPGLIDTPMNAGLKKAEDDAPPVPLDRYALRRWGRPEEVAACILFLLSRDSSYLTGSSVAVDGGRSFH